MVFIDLPASNNVDALRVVLDVNDVHHLVLFVQRCLRENG